MNVSVRFRIDRAEMKIRTDGQEFALPINRKGALVLARAIAENLSPADASALARDILYDKQSIAAIWNIEDVRMVADNYRLKISDDDLMGILESVDDNHDAGLGINWDTLDSQIQLWMSENKLAPEEVDDEE